MSDVVLFLFIMLGVFTLLIMTGTMSGTLYTLRLFRPRLERNASRVLEELLAGEKVIASVNATLRVRRQDKIALHLGGNDVWYVRRYPGLLVITESRLVFADKFFFLKRGHVSPLSEVSSLDLSPNFFNSQFQVIGPDWFIDYVIKYREAEPFFATAQEVLARAHAQAQAPAAALSAAVEVNGYKIEPGANLVGANLSGAILVGANLTDADLFGAYLSGANLTNANLTDAHLFGAHLIAANLTRADLTRADLTRADLTGAILVGANLTDADLEDVIGYNP